MSLPLSLLAAVQNYAWGLPASSSLVATLHAQNASTEPDPTLPYAELWIGTHPAAPSILSNGTPLSTHLSNSNSPDLPYLFKILSVAAPLSIQAHPDRALAARLHAANPTTYRDANHKPEMSVALTDFEGMCSFRPLADVVAHLRAIPALAALCGGEPAIQRAEQATGPDTKKALRSLFESLMTSSESHVADSLHGTVLSLKKANTSDADDLFLRLVDYYPADVGCFAAYLLNHIHIKPGEAFFMAANEPHAYLKGQCVEIMAASDNVVRAGLTPKFKDVSTLVDMLTYVDAPPVIMQGNPIDDFSTVYQPPAEEFQVTKYCIPQGVRHQLPPAKGPGIILCIAGSGTLALDVDAPQPDNSPLPLQPGAIFYIPDSQPLLVSVHMSSDPSQQLFFFRAGINQSCVH